MKIKYLLTAALLSLYACTEEPLVPDTPTPDPDPKPEVTPSVTYNIKGSVQKGPFIQGTSINIQGLDDALNPTGKNWQTKTSDDAGTFAIESKIESELVDVTASGYYFNEIEGKISTSPITLRTLSDLSSEGTTNINVLTTLAYERILKLVKIDGLKIDDARKQAEAEVLQAFNIISGSASGGFDKLDISKKGEGNAVLLAISAILQQGRSEGEMSELLSKIASDISSDGTLDNEKICEDIKQQGMAIDIEKTRANLDERYSKLGVSGYSIPAFEDYLDVNGNGVVDKEDSWLVADIEEFTVASEGGRIEFLLKHNVEYDVTYRYDAGDGWIRRIESKAYLQTATLAFEVLPNDTPDERYAIINVSAADGSISAEIRVTQKQKDALTVSATSFTLGTEGGVIDLKVTSNVDCSVEIDPESKSWVTLARTKALSEKDYTFNVAPSEEPEDRTGYIYVKGNGMTETIEIHQAGEHVLVVGQKDFTLSRDSGVVKVEVTSNIDYDVTIENSPSWIHLEPTVKSIVTRTLRFIVDENASYDDRQAVIRISDPTTQFYEKVTVYQTQTDAIIIARDSYSFDEKGGVIDVDIQTNMDIMYEIPQECAGWIQEVKTKGLQDVRFSFNVAENDLYEPRSGSIIFRDSASKIVKKVDVFQGQYNVIKVNPDTLRLKRWVGGEFTVNISSNVDYEIINPVDWVTIYETKSLESDNIIVKVSSRQNEQTDYDRETTLTVRSLDGSVEAGLTIIQPPYPYFDVPEDEIILPYMAGTHTVDFICNVDYTTEVTEGSDWLTVVPQTKAWDRTLTVAYGKNENSASRRAVVKITEVGNDKYKQLLFTQDGNGELRTFHVQTPGTFADMVTYEELKEIVNLKITGSINNTDLALFDTNQEYGYWALKYLDLSEVELVDKVLNIGSIRNKSALGNASLLRTFHKLKEVYLPASLEELGDNAFNECYALEKVVFHPQSRLKAIRSETGFSNSSGWLGVATLPYGAFFKCTSLKEIEFPASLEILEGGTFSACSSLEKVTFAPGSKIKELDSKLFTGSQGSYVSPNAKRIPCAPFTACESLTTIEIPSSVEYIGDYAFKDCIGLTHMVIPETVKEVNNLAGIFAGCSLLTEVTLPALFDRIGDYMFAGCTNLRKINSAVELTDLGAYALQDCNSLEYDLSKVESIGAYSLSGIANEKVKIPTHITHIPEGLFAGCANLKEVDFSNVTSIGNRAFWECTSLVSITIPDTVTEIGESVFRLCTSLKNFNLSGGSLSIGEGTLYGTAVEELVIPAEMTCIKGYGQYGVGQYNSCIKKIVFEEGSKCVEFGFAEKMEQLSSINLPESLKIISDNAFRGCTSLTSIAIPSGVEAIGKEAFASSGLLSLALPSSLKSVGAEAFANLGITSVTVPEGVEEIGGFERCRSLRSIDLPNTLKRINNAAFKQCESLRPFKINGCDSLTLGYGFLDDCPLIEKITFSKNIRYLASNPFNSIGLPLSGSYVSNVNFEEGSQLVEINERVFSGTTEASSFSITLPEGLEIIGAKAFRQNSNLKSITIPSTVTTIGESAFDECAGLTEVVIPESVKALGKRAFAISTLSKVSLSEGLESIGDRCFYEAALTEINLPSTLKSIGICAFYKTLLSSVVIPDGVTKYDSSCFNDCSSMTEITYGKGIVSISAGISGCKSLKTVRVSENIQKIRVQSSDIVEAIYCPANVPPTLDLNRTLPSGLIFYVPAAAVDTYKAAKEWSKYPSQIVGYQF